MPEAILRKALFYQALSPLHALPRILEKLYRENIRCLLYTPDITQRDDINTLLWTYQAESFLPHARSCDPHPTLQPILVSEEATPLNHATAVMTLDGEGLNDHDTFSAYYYLFKAGDEDATAKTRDHWRRHQQNGHALSMYRQNAHGWNQIK